MSDYTKMDGLFAKLVKKTRELGHQVTYEEMEQDASMPRPNEYAYYYGSFTNAAVSAWRSVKRGDSSEPNDKTIDASPKQPKKPKIGIDPKREEVVVNEFVDMFIESNGIMPSQRMIKKNPYISEKEVDILRRTGRLNERTIRRLAEEKSGKTFQSRQERRLENSMRSKAKAKAEAEAEKAPELLESQNKIQEVQEAHESHEVHENREVRKVHEVCTPSREVKNMARKISTEELKEVLREFAVKNLRWPTDKEIHEFQEQKVPGWASSAHLYRQFGAKSAWGEQIFPEGLPEGFKDGGKKRAEKPAEPAKDQKEATGPKPPTVNITSSDPRGNQVVIPICITVPENVKIVSGVVSLTVEF